MDPKHRHAVLEQFAYDVKLALTQVAAVYRQAPLSAQFAVRFNAIMIHPVLRVLSFKA